MALRESANCGEMAKSGSACAVSGLPASWDSGDAAPRTEWEDWWDLFTVAVNAKYSLSVNELLRIATEQAPWNLALINNLNEPAAERKAISALFLSVGTAGREECNGQNSRNESRNMTLHELRTICDEAFSKPRNRTLERFMFFSRKQEEKETLGQFWHLLTGLVTKCEFGEQTESLVIDSFIQNMNNKTVQERRCTEPKNDPQEASRFAVVYEEGVYQHKTYEGRNVCKEIKQAECKAKHERCRNCALIGHFASMCKKSGSFRGRGRINYQAGIRRVNPIGLDDDQLDASSEPQEDKVVLDFENEQRTSTVCNEREN